MVQDKKLLIISNEKISENDSFFYCDNIDLKSIPEELDKKLNICLIARKSNIKRFHQIKLKKIELIGNIFSFLLSIFKTFSKNEANYLLISITPYTFFAYLFLFLFKKRTFVYLRSNGYEEYKEILGFFGPAIYHLMYVVVTFKSQIIVCQKRLAKSKKYDLVSPSELDSNWLENRKVPSLDKPRLLYVGRIKVEKGIFSLTKIFDEIADNVELSIAGKKENPIKSKKNINFLGLETNISKLIKIYDNHNITVLPSFTEAHPKALDESLARLRPVIIFNEISHIIDDRYGVFVSNRDSNSFLKTINFIMKNYENIKEDMKKNKLPTKKEFILQITKILS